MRATSEAIRGTIERTREEPGSTSEVTAAPDPDVNFERTSSTAVATLPFELPPYLSRLIASINDGAKAAQTGGLFFLGVGLYLMAVAFATTDEDLFRNKTIAISQLGVGIKPVVSYAMAPLIFVFLHVHTLIRFDMVAANLKQLDAELSTVKGERDRERCRHLLANVEYLRGNGGNSGSPLTSRLFRGFSVFMLAVFPIGVLTLVQLSSLRYQNESIVFAQRFALLVDLALLIWFSLRLWRLNQPREHSFWRARHAILLRALWPLPLIAINVVYMGIPTPDATTVGPEANRNSEERAQSPFRSFQSLANYQVVDEWLCIDLNLFCRYLTVDNRLLVANTPPSEALRQLRMDNARENLKSNLATIDGLDLRDRTFRFINLKGSRLYGATLANGQLQGAVLWGAQLQGADLWQANLKNATLESAQLEMAHLAASNLERANLRNVNLQGANLWNAKLTNADLSDAKLTGANFDQANLQGANLTNAQLKDANLSEANLQDAILDHAELRGANLSLAHLKGVKLKAAQLQGTDLTRAELHGADFTSAELQGANFSSAQLQGADFTNAALQSVDFSSAQLQGADFTNAALQGACLHRAELPGANLDHASLQGADLSYAKLQGADLSHARLQGANLWRAELQGVNLEGAQLQGADAQDANLSPGRLLEKVDLNLADLRGVDFSEITKEERAEVLTSLATIPDAERRDSTIRRVESALTPANTSSPRPPATAKAGFVLIDTGRAPEWQNLGAEDVLTDQAAFDTKLTPYLVNLARSDDAIARGIAQRIFDRASNEQSRALYTNLAGPMLEAEKKGTIKLPDDISNRLELFAQRTETVPLLP